MFGFLLQSLGGEAGGWGLSKVATWGAGNEFSSLCSQSISVQYDILSGMSRSISKEISLNSREL